MGKGDIELLRKQINEIDREVLKLLQKRVEVAREIGRYKHENNLPLYDPAREREVISRILNENQGIFPEKSLEYIFREIIAACRGSEEKLKISFLGPPGTFTHIAGIRFFGNEVNYIPREDIGEIFEDVSKGRSNFGIVPVENSLQGTVTYVLDLFLEYSLKIFGEIYMEIEHSLYSKEEDLSRIRVLYSHPQAIAQCRGWIKKNLPGVKIVETFSTAEAASRASEEDGSAAICTDWAGTIYGLKLLARGIQDNPVNTTRFFIIAREEAPYVEGVGYKTSISMILKDEPGSLFSALSPFALYKVNMTKIESRPLKGKEWEYVFFIDMDGHYRDERVARTLEEVRKHTISLEILGSYPVGMEDKKNE